MTAKTDLDRTSRRRDIQGAAVWSVFGLLYTFLVFGLGTPWAPLAWFNACALGVSVGMLAYHVWRLLREASAEPHQKAPDHDR